MLNTAAAAAAAAAAADNNNNNDKHADGVSYMKNTIFPHFYSPCYDFFLFFLDLRDVCVDLLADDKDDELRDCDSS